MNGIGKTTWALGCVVMLLTGTRSATAANVVTTPKVMNNFVTEVLNVQNLVQDGASSYRIETSREGWLFFRAQSWTGKAGSLRLSIAPEGADANAAEILFSAEGGRKTNEAMRYLRKGAYTLRAELKDAELTALSVRVIPAIIYASHPYPPLLPRFGQYDWGWLKQIGMLDSINVIITGNDSCHFMKDWLAQGKQVLQRVSVPGVNVEKPVTKDEVYDFWAHKAGLNNPGMSGVIADEFYPGAEKYYPAWLPAIQRVRKDKPDKVFYPYISGDPEKLKSFVEPLLASECRFAYERYLPEMRTEQEARQTIERQLKDPMVEFNKYAPGFAGRCMYVMGFLCGPNETLNRNPGADFKVYTDMQFNLMATDPAFKELYGVQMYLSAYCDSEYMRWCAKLFRHYCIEGSAERLSNDPYLLDHIRNPDFEDGLKGWTVDAAATDSVKVGKMAKYGWLQGRYPPSDEGDIFLLMKRSEKKPNSVSQEIRNLQPGRFYSIKMYTGDYGNLTRWDLNEVAIRIEGADPVPDERIQGVFHNAYDHLAPQFGKANTFFNFHRAVFQATASTARLTISDWLTPERTDGTIGQETAINFIEVEPYLMPD